jgi:hypothetical protein
MLVEEKKKLSRFEKRLVANVDFDDPLVGMLSSMTLHYHH